LQVGEPAFTIAHLSQVPNEDGEQMGRRQPDLAHLQFHRKRRAILASGDHGAADGKDMPLTGGRIAFDIAILISGVRGRHQAVDIAADEFGGCGSEHPLRRRADGLNEPPVIDDDEAVGDGIENGEQQRFATLELVPGSVDLAEACGDLGGADDFPSVVPHGRDRDRHRDGAAIFRKALGLKMRHHGATADFRENECFLGYAFGRDDAHHRRTDHFRRGKAEQGRRGRVPEGHAAFQVFGDNGGVGGGRDRCQQRSCVIGSDLVSSGASR